ncbi:dimethylarginine dimethylaminohydrolase family protein [Nocardia terpenica]|uniref:Amidinotransferase n=1 Tax=Nocardia terpenica TaxID=455432 RepID=A0A291RR84_9NOCA|nr:arginine deiminase-related protein [Nocardia terpenica]ATL69742.1 amidinotransferase [Nocardia terpenica]
MTTTAPAPVVQPINATQLDRPAYLLNPPFSFSTDVANNIWMEELTGAEREPNARKAMVQFLDLYSYLAAEGLVYLLPTPRTTGLQDLVFTANLGIVLEHLPDRKTVVLSNFTSPPRVGETEVGRVFFESMGYQVHVPETKFEGEAELKHLHDNVYVGGYGLRSQRETYDWMERTFDMKIVKLAETDPYLYHLDCSVFPITREQTLVCTEMFEDEEIEELEKYTDIIEVSADAAYSGLCNSVRLHNTIINASHIHDLKAGSKDYSEELAKNRELEDIANELAFELTLVNLSEYHKGGALLSCMVMHLNRYSYTFPLL